MSYQLTQIFEDFLGDYRKHNVTSGQISFDCPACSADKGMPEGDGKGNLEVNYNRGVFKCWACSDTNHMKGGIPFLIRRYGNSDLLNQYFKFKPDQLEYDTHHKAEIDLKLPKEFKLLSECDSSYFLYDKAMHTLKKRGIGEKIIDKYNIGYCYKGEYGGRIIIPSYDDLNVLNYYVARSFEKGIWPKYKNPAAEKQTLIINERFLNFDSTIYLVEGMFDHIVVPNSVPLLGKVIGGRLKELLLERAKANIVILLDADALNDAINLYRELNFGPLYNRIKICVPPNDHDPSSFYEKYGYKGIFHLLKSSYKIEESEIY
jgi:hypothetical protein